MLVLMLAAAAGMTTGCERHKTTEVYYLISANLGLPYWKTAAEGFNKAALQYHVTARVVGPDTYDPAAEAKELEKTIALRPAGILISVSDESTLKAGIDEAIDAGIPVITIDSDAVHSHRLFFIGTNNRAAGQLGGQRLADKLDGKGNVVFYSMPGQPNMDERLQGFKDALAKYPAIKTLDVIDIKGDARNAFDNTQQYLAQTGALKVAAFVCLESSSGKTVSDVLKRQKATDRELIAMDVDPDTLNGIKDGTIDATIAQKPFTMAFYGLKALDEIHHSPPKSFSKDYSVDSFSPYPVFVDTGTSIVDKVNVDLYLSSAAAESR